jgi:hypothetical protein
MASKVLPNAGKRKLPPNAGKGRVKGVPNKATQAAREAIGLFVDANAHRLQVWLDKIAETDPEKAFAMFQSVIEYHVPKLARSEHTGKDGGEIKAAITVRFV